MSRGWGDLLPAHRADGDDQPVGAPRVLAQLPLGEDVVLGVVADAAGRCFGVPMVGDRRAIAGDGAAQRLVTAIGAGDLDRDDFRLTTWHHREAVGERAITVDQTNESVVVGEQAVVKWIHHVEPGPHPAPALLASLTAAGFAGTPRPWAVLEWRGRLLASVVDLVPGAVDGWTWAVDDLRAGDATAAGDAVGRLVADFHGALAATARPATTAEVAAWRTETLADLDRALQVSRSPVLRQHTEQARAVLGAIELREAPTMQPVHGDLHVGQVLRDADGRYLLTDFDGNPVAPDEHRGRPEPVALDVAGLAQSFVHAGLVVRRHHPELDPAAVTAAAGAARDAFLAGYADVAGPVSPALLRAYALRQVCREFSYAASHLPRWAYVPEAALPMLLEECP